jgi:hypothetical protein
VPPGPIRRCTCAGAVAQLGERFHGMEEVRGSIPLSSTLLEDLTVLCARFGSSVGPVLRRAFVQDRAILIGSTRTA